MSGKDLLWSGWGRGPNWDDPDEHAQLCARQLVRGTVYWLRRLLDARGGWEILTVRGEGYSLRRLEGLRVQEPAEQIEEPPTVDDMPAELTSEDAPEQSALPASTTYDQPLPGMRDLIDAERELLERSG